MLVSIVIPSYNYASYIEEALSSALHQSHSTCEVVVVDDGSTDNTRGVVAAFLPEVQYIYKTRGGPSSARNVGASRARGEMIVFLDADDVLHQRYVEECLVALPNRRRQSYVYTQIEWFGARSGTSRFPPYDRRLLCKGNYIHVSSLIPTEAVRRFPYDESLRSGLEDWDFYLTLADHGYRGLLLDRPLLRCRVHPPDHGSFGSRVAEDIAHRVRLVADIQRRHRETCPPSIRLVQRAKVLAVGARFLKRGAEPDVPPAPKEAE